MKDKRQQLEFLEKNIWFSIPVHKIKFHPPPQGKNALVFIFKSFIKSANFSRCGNFIKKFNFVSTPSKIIIPTAHHPPYHLLNRPSPTPPPTLPLSPTTSLTSTPHCFKKVKSLTTAVKISQQMSHVFVEISIFGMYYRLELS